MPGGYLTVTQTFARNRCQQDGRGCCHNLECALATANGKPSCNPSTGNKRYSSTASLSMTYINSVSRLSSSPLLRHSSALWLDSYLQWTVPVLVCHDQQLTHCAQLHSKKCSDRFIKRLRLGQKTLSVVSLNTRAVRTRVCLKHSWYVI